MKGGRGGRSWSSSMSNLFSWGTQPESPATSNPDEGSGGSSASEDDNESDGEGKAGSDDGASDSGSDSDGESSSSSESGREEASDNKGWKGFLVLLQSSWVCLVGMHREVWSSLWMSTWDQWW